MEERKLRVWSMPGEGNLSGIIISTGDSTIELKDFNDKIWNVNFAGADIVPAVSLIDGEKIKLIGKMTGDNSFEADAIRPWGGFQHRYHGGRNNR